MSKSDFAVMRGRLAPSPTGLLHLGNAYAFLVAWLSARSQGGVLVLRMEDIDPERSKTGFAAGICNDLDWLGLDCDESPQKGGPYAPYAQGERLGRYAALLKEFEQAGLLYSCYCTRKELRMLASAPHVGDEGAPYPGNCRSLDEEQRIGYEASGRHPALRLDVGATLRHMASGHAGAGPQLVALSEVDDKILHCNDKVLGPQAFLPGDCGGDFALRRSDGVVAYQLATSVDDAAMAISEVVRGEDLLLSTPRQLLLHRLLRRKPPCYAHLPLLHDARGERLAKRHKSLTLASLRAAGASPEAVVGYIGWLAGFLERPVPARPGELLPAFSFAVLRGRRMHLPEDAAMRIVDLSRL